MPRVRAGAAGLGSRILLAEMIQSLREELQAAMQDGDEEALACRVNGVELELDVAIERESKTEGPVRFYVIEANAGAQDERETHVVRISLGPLEPEES